MSSTNIIRAWKDEEYRLSLSEAERALIPENPAGLTELSSTELSRTTGGLAAGHTHTTTVCVDCPWPK
jgi:mersacidin/lichenicidin family type 2 lantibiotic